MTDTDAYIQRLLTANPVREPVLRSAIQALRLLPRSQGLDVGCGIGLQELLLAEAVGPEGHVTGVDIVPEFLSYGNDLAQKAGFSDRIAFREGEAGDLPFADQSFDWVWSADCVGYPAGDLLPVLKELMRVARPGGRIAILGWTSQQLLPGYALLEARLNAACSAYLPFLEGKPPEQHFLRALHWFREAGFVDAQVRTFVGEVQAPLDAGQRAALASLFEMLWLEPGSGPSQADWRETQRLCRPQSEDFILDDPDYYAFFTCTLFRGSVPGG